MQDGVRDPIEPEEQGWRTRKIVDPDKSRYSGKNKLKIKKYDGIRLDEPEGRGVAADQRRRRVVKGTSPA